MRATLTVVAVVTIVLGSAAADYYREPPSSLQRDVRTKRSYDRWLDIISQFARRGGGEGANAFQPFPVDLPIAGKDGTHTSVPVLVLPIPVPVPGNQECSANKDRISYKETDNRNKNYDVRLSSSTFSQDDRYETEESSVKVSSDYLIEVFKRQQATAPDLPPALIGYAPEITYPSISSSKQYLSSSSSRQYLPPSDDDSPPAPPKFDRSMIVRGFLTVHKSDYTESYTAKYDAKTGASRVEFHDGGTTCYRTMMSGGRVKRSMMYTDRTEEREMVVCGVTSPGQASSEDGKAPGLPYPEGFSFAGYKEEFGVRAEVWKREERGRPGEKGAARGESLVFRHELLIHRRQDGFTVPLRYKVEIDSSVLGPNCDGYEHIYSEVREKEHNEDEFNHNTDRQCDKVEQMDSNNPEHMAQLDPLREFTLLQRDSRYDAGFDNYIKEYERSYADSKEEAVRKNLFVQRNRFVSSCNRQSATFTVEVNFLSDRLDEEVESILGVSFTAEFENNTVSFPLSENRLGSAGKKQPKQFDWRPRGAVSSVKFQGEACSSCWAFAVTGSVEGALFIKTKQFVELSVQCLVDCSVSHGAHGCNSIGTWPVNAYNYIRDRGIVADAEYPPYDKKDHKCKAPPATPTTHIEGGVDVPPNNIEAVKVAIRRFAPTVVVIDAKPQTVMSYKKGVLRDDRCIKGPKAKLNHAVLAVGWGEQRGAPHFIIKNSWSTAWGEAGYIRLHAPTNTCGHLTVPSFALLKRSNVDKLPGGQGAGSQGRSGGDSGEQDYDERR